MVRPTLAVAAQKEVWVAVAWTCRAASGPHATLQTAPERGAHQEPAAAGCPCLWLTSSAVGSEASAQAPEPEGSLSPSDGPPLGAGPTCVFPKLHYTCFLENGTEPWLSACSLTSSVGLGLVGVSSLSAGSAPGR